MSPITVNLVGLSTVIQSQVAPTSGGWARGGWAGGCSSPIASNGGGGDA